jgi:hypothetical protein
MDELPEEIEEDEEPVRDRSHSESESDEEEEEKEEQELFILGHEVAQVLRTRRHLHICDVFDWLSSVACFVHCLMEGDISRKSGHHVPAKSDPELEPSSAMVWLCDNHRDVKRQ